MRLLEHSLGGVDRTDRGCPRPVLSTLSAVIDAHPSASTLLVTFIILFLHFEVRFNNSISPEDYIVSSAL